MPRLVDLLEYLTKPGLEDIWILLDIKVCIYDSNFQARVLTGGKLDDDPDTLLCNMAAAIKAVKASRKWAERIILGCWNVSLSLHACIPM